MAGEHLSVNRHSRSFEHFWTFVEKAVDIARENAKSGDVISLSPASASFDKYKDFEERGRHFKSIVKGLK